MQKRSGFTLMELMVAIAIICVMAAVVSPNVLQWLQGRRLTMGTREIFSDLNRARLRAVKENTPAVIAFDVNDNLYRIFLDYNHNNHYDPDTDTRLVLQKMPAGVLITDASFAGGAPRMRFDGRGLPNGFGGHVALADGRGHVRRVVVNITGNLRVSG